MLQITFTGNHGYCTGMNYRVFLAGIFLVAFLSCPIARAEALSSIALNSPMPVTSYTNTYAEPSHYLPRLFSDGSLALEYYAYKPGLPPSDKKPPLLLALHGGGRTGASMIDKWQTLADAESVVIIAPTAKANAWASTDVMLDYLVSLARHAVDEFGADPERVYVFGHSSGAVTALHLGAFRSRAFAAVAVHAGSAYFNEKPCTLRRGVPIILISGTDDTIFTRTKVRDTAKEFDEAGATVTHYEIAGHTHWYYDIADFVNAIAWRDMENHRAAPPSLAERVASLIACSIPGYR